MDRAQKAELVAELKSTFEGTSVVIVTRNLGLTVAQSTALRTKMREAGASYKVSKNKLARIAVEGTTYNAINDLLVGPTALSTSADPVAPAKVIVDFAKTNDKLVIRGGVYGGKVLDQNGVKQLASIPSKEVLLAQLCGLLKSPISRTAVVLGALAAKKGEGAAAPAEEAAAA